MSVTKAEIENRNELAPDYIPILRIKPLNNSADGLPSFEVIRGKPLRYKVAWKAGREMNILQFTEIEKAIIKFNEVS